MAEPAGQRRFQFSTWTLMVAVAFCALLLAPLVWMFRHAEAMRLERAYTEHARALAEERAAVAAQAARAAQAAAKLGTADQKKAGSLWAGLSINHPIFKAGQAGDLRIEFTLVNDGDKVIEPKVPESQIVINGKELADSVSIFSSVLEGARYEGLSPGDSLQFGLPLGDRFEEPGTYRIAWKGVGFDSPEIVLRILPEGAR